MATYDVIRAAGHPSLLAIVVGSTSSNQSAVASQPGLPGSVTAVGPPDGTFAQRAKAVKRFKI